MPIRRAVLAGLPREHLARQAALAAQDVLPLLPWWCFADSLTAAVLAWADDPTPKNRAALAELQNQHGAELRGLLSDPRTRDAARPVFDAVTLATSRRLPDPAAVATEALNHSIRALEAAAPPTLGSGPSTAERRVLERLIPDDLTPGQRAFAVGRLRFSTTPAAEAIADARSFAERPDHDLSPGELAADRAGVTRGEWLSLRRARLSSVEITQGKDALGENGLAAYIELRATAGLTHAQILEAASRWQTVSETHLDNRDELSTRVEQSTAGVVPLFRATVQAGSSEQHYAFTTPDAAEATARYLAGEAARVAVQLPTRAAVTAAEPFILDNLGLAATDSRTNAPAPTRVLIHQSDGTSGLERGVRAGLAASGAISAAETWGQELARSARLTPDTRQISPSSPMARGNQAVRSAGDAITRFAVEPSRETFHAVASTLPALDAYLSTPTAASLTDGAHHSALAVRDAVVGLTDIYVAPTQPLEAAEQVARQIASLHAISKGQTLTEFLQDPRAHGPQQIGWQSAENALRSFLQDPRVERLGALTRGTAELRQWASEHGSLMATSYWDARGGEHGEVSQLGRDTLRFERGLEAIMDAFANHEDHSLSRAQAIENAVNHALTAASEDQAIRLTQNVSTLILDAEDLILSEEAAASVLESVEAGVALREAAQHALLADQLLAETETEQAGEQFRQPLLSAEELEDIQSAQEDHDLEQLLAEAQADVPALDQALEAEGPLPWEDPDAPIPEEKLAAESVIEDPAVAEAILDEIEEIAPTLNEAEAEAVIDAEELEQVISEHTDLSQEVEAPVEAFEEAPVEASIEEIAEAEVAEQVVEEAAIEEAAPAVVLTEDNLRSLVEQGAIEPDALARIADEVADKAIAECLDAGLEATENLISARIEADTARQSLSLLPDEAHIAAALEDQATESATRSLAASLEAAPDPAEFEKELLARLGQTVGLELEPEDLTPDRLGSIQERLDQGADLQAALALTDPSYEETQVLGPTLSIG